MDGCRSSWARRGLGVAMATAALLGAGVAPASAVENAPMSFSDDGRAFSQSAGANLLDSLGLIVPGESITASMWVRNDSPGPAVVRVSIRELDIPSRDFADGVSLATWNSGTGQTVDGTLRSVAPCSVIVPSQSIASGVAMRFQLTFAMADVENQAGQGQRARMSLMVAMRDERGGNFAASACDDKGTVITSSPKDTSPDGSGANGSGPNGSAPDSSAPDSFAPDGTTAPVSSAGRGQLPTESVPRADVAPVEITLWGFTLLRMTGEDLSALFVVSAGLASGVGMFVLAARRRRGREDV